MTSVSALAVVSLLTLHIMPYSVRRLLTTGVWQYYIDQITAPCPGGNWGPACDGLEWEDIFDDIRDQLLVDANIGFIPPCSTSVRTTVSVYTGQCLKINCTTSQSLISCPNAYCIKTCDICTGPTGGIEMQNCSTDVIGTPDCETYPGGFGGVTVGDEWELDCGVCFLYQCDE